jgi:hypothetical protein
MRMKRSQVLPLASAADIYAVLVHLHAGEFVPPQVYIRDYQDGTIPPWMIREIEAHDRLLIVTVCDEQAPVQATLFAPAHLVARDIFTMPTKTLAGPLYGYYPGCVHARNPLADIRQYARQIVDYAQKKEAADGSMAVEMRGVV